MLMDSGLFAVQVSDIGGRLVSDAPRRLLLPATVGGVNPKLHAMVRSPKSSEIDWLFFVRVAEPAAYS